ncbi:hypothetical protein NM688_g2751 [Phlebia brevispora]|uniref:Uncharacterized protein n=1 Tax=Phlebia brevispora TaxID=194682 RepID=A0ACC1T7S1_9APHY|nr:hypothetical protein NM688_g2751 [Phlebia brevispora]
MGWDVVATDLPVIVDAVLARNIATNLPELPPDSGAIQVRALDWTVAPEDWTWNAAKVIASADGTAAPSDSPSEGTSLLAPPFDLIITADTVYSTELAIPLLRTLHALSEQSITASLKGIRAPPIYLCLERRDPILVDQTLAEAAKLWTVKRVPHGKLTHAIEKGGLQWDKAEWEDVEIWTFAQKHN